MQTPTNSMRMSEVKIWSEDSKYTVRVNKSAKHMIKLLQFEMTGYMQYFKNYIEYCCDY